MSEPAAWRVVLLLAGAFRAAIDEVHAELEEHGHSAARPLHGFALQAIGPDGCTIVELGSRLGVTKQAAAKTASALAEIGYVRREPVSGDRRAVLLRRTPAAEEMLALSETGFERTVNRWRSELGAQRFDVMVEALLTIGADEPVGDLPGWLAQRLSRVSPGTT